MPQNRFDHGLPVASAPGGPSPSVDNELLHMPNSIEMIATITQGPRPHQGSSTRTTSATTSSTPDSDDSESLEPTSTCCSFPRTDGGPLHLDDILEPTAFSPTPASSSCSTHVTPSPISIFSTPQSRYTEPVRHRGVQRQRGAEPAAAQPRTRQTTAAGEGSAEENSSHQPLGRQQNRFARAMPAR